MINVLLSIFALIIRVGRPHEAIHDSKKYCNVYLIFYSYHL